MTADASKRLQVGECVVDVARCEIFRPGRIERIKPKAMEVLAFLAGHAGEVVSRRDIFDAVWGDAVVTDDVLSQSIRELRQALGDDAQAPRYIETVPRRGYCLLAPVAIAKAPARRQLHRFALAGAAGLCGLVLAGATVWFVFGQRSVPVLGTSATLPNTLAVLPFADPQNDSHTELLADGVSDAITTVLAQSPDLTVAARTSAFYFKGRNVPVPEIASQLHVAYVLEGSVYQTDGRVRVYIQLVDRNGFHHWAKQYDRPTQDIFALIDSITADVLAGIDTALAASPQRAAEALGAHDPQAYLAYLEATQLRYRRGVAQLDQAARLYHKAIAEDPNFARAWSGLSQTYLAMVAETPIDRRGPVFVQAYAAMNRALSLDPDLAEPYAILAVKQEDEGDLVAADRSFRHALARDPRAPDVISHYGRFLLTVGRLADAVKEFRRALEIDPLTPVRSEDLGGGLLFLGRYEEATKRLAEARRLGDTGTYWNDLHIDAARGDWEDVRAIATTTWKAEGTDYRWLNPVIDYLEGRGSLPAALSAVASERGKIHPGTIFATYVYLGQFDEALAVLRGEGAIKGESGALDLQMWLPVFSGLRRRPGFGQLMKDLGLVEYWRATVWADDCRPAGNDVVCH